MTVGGRGGQLSVTNDVPCSLTGCEMPTTTELALTLMVGSLPLRFCCREHAVYFTDRLRREAMSVGQ